MSTMPGVESGNLDAVRLEVRKVKETAGRATGNSRLERKGETDQVKGKVKNVGEKAKDKLRGR